MHHWHDHLRSTQTITLYVYNAEKVGRGGGSSCGISKEVGGGGGGGGWRGGERTYQ